MKGYTPTPGKLGSPPKSGSAVRKPVVILLRQSCGQIAEVFMRPLDTSAEEMFRRQNPER